MKLVIAIPTIVERGIAWEDIARLWVEWTPLEIICEPSWRKPTWAAGLNEVWEKHPDADVFVAGSDDMEPTGPWLDHALEHFNKNECPVPSVFDPRMTTHGGMQDVFWKEPPTEGCPAKMTNFPILKGEWLCQLFPLNPEMHYYSDDKIGDKLRKAGIPLVTCLDIKIRHTMDERGRGAGMGSESARMAHDRKIYRSLA